MRILKKLLNISAVLTVLVSIAQLFPGEVHLFQLLEAFQLQTILGAFILSLLAVVSRNWISVAILFFCGFVIYVDSRPYTWQLSETVLFKEKVSVTHANIWHHNTQFEDAFIEIASTNSDIILIQELSEEMTERVPDFFPDHSHRVLIPHKECCYGIGLLSAFPILKCDTVDLENTPVLVATIQTSDELIDLIYIHTRPPALPDETAERDRQLEAAKEIISDLDNPWILAGDLNVVPWAEPFHQLLKETEAVDARLGAAPTFPTTPFPLIPIDHIIHEKSLRNGRLSTFKIPGSDHCGTSVQIY